MTWRYIFALGLRNLTSRRSRTFLTIGGVAIGIMAVIFLVSVGYGLQRLAISETLKSKSLNYFDIKVGTGTINKLDAPTMKEFASYNNVKNVYPRLETTAKISLSGTSTKADIIAFVQDTAFTEQSDISLGAGHLYADDKDEMLISSAVLGLLSVSQDQILNKQVTFQLSIRDELQVNTLEASDITFTVIGITDDDETPYLVTPIKPTTAKLGEFAFSAAKVEVNNPSDISTVRSQIEGQGGLQTEYIGDTIDQLNGIFKIIQAVLAGFGLIATFVAALGMFNTLSVSLLERTREIGIMKTLGTRRGDVWKLFLVEGMLISVLGGLGGIVLGLTVGYSLNGAVNLLARATGNNPTSFYYAPPLFLALIMALVVLLGVLVGLIPARRATKISPLEALRYE